MAAKSPLRPIGFKPWEISNIHNTHILEQHVADAAFLWTTRDRAVVAPHYRLRDIARLDERVEAHLDGLRLAGGIGLELAAQGVESEDPGSLFVAALLALETKAERRIRPLAELSVTNKTLTREMISALGWVHAQDLASTLEWLSKAANPMLRSLAISGYRVSGIDPGGPLRTSMRGSEAIVLESAFKAAGVLGRVDLAHIIAGYSVGSDDPARYSAAWACARLGLRDRDVVGSLKRIAQLRHASAEPALFMAVRCLRLDEAGAWLEQLLRIPGLIRRTVKGIGILGDPAFVERLLGYMNVDKLSRVAGESFSLITGVDIKYQDLNQKKPEGFEARPNDDPEDPDVEMDPDEDLPWPSPDLVQQWWDKNKSNYQFGTRYFLGQPIGEISLVEALRVGFQRQRTAAAIEVGLLNPSQPLFDTRSPGAVQLERVGRWNS
jgi:uncharacterized protein (TIGR02270 family)